jgi:uncharacterized membrane protein
MWFVGMIAGAMIGSLLPGGGMVLAGAAIGLIAGAVYGARIKPQRDTSSKLDQELGAQIAKLSARLTIIERRLGIDAPSTAPVDAQPPPATHDAVVSPAVAEPIPEQPAAPSLPLAAATPEAPAAIPSESGTPRQTDATADAPAQVDDFLRFWRWLIGGNILAKIGVVLLFFGVASGLRLAVQYGFMPIPVRLGMGAIAATAMIWFGHNRVAKGLHEMFGHALQGGGFAILYLIVYFMLARYQMIGAAPAFLIFAAIGTVCVLMAARQNAQSLAGLGISGAFLAPILASSGSGEYIVLFSYYLLLNAFVVTVNWFKGWRYLNLAAFAFTFLVGFAWGSRSYRPEYFATIEAFLIVFFLIFSALPVLMIVCNAPGKRSVADGLLLFGAPIAAAGFQQAIVDDRMALAWSATIAGLYYLALWRLLFVRHDPSIEVVERSQLGIGAVFLTMAVPLAFGAQVTTVLWALEGAVLLWYGLRLNRSLACAAGLLLQFGAGVYFIVHIGDLDHARPFFNSVVIGAIVIALAALFGARLLERAGQAPDWSRSTSKMLLLWALAWIAYAAWRDIDVFVEMQNRPAALLAVAAILALLFDAIGRALGSRLLRTPAWLLTPGIPLLLALHLADNAHLLTGAFALALPAAFAVQYWINFRFDRDNLEFGKRTRHFLAFWTLGAAVGIELAWWTGERSAAAAEGFWKLMAWMATGVAMIAAVIKGVQARRWPFSGALEGYLSIACAPVLVLLGLAVVFSGRYSADWGMPYVPPLNPLEIVSIAAIAAIIWWGDCAKEQLAFTQAATFASRIGYLLGFVLLNFILARVAHHWFGVAYQEQALFRSALLQGLLSFVWTCLAIGLMIHASRERLRANWFIGFGLLAIVGAKLLLVDAAHAGTVIWTGTLIGVALLVIAASYFAPRPPAQN